METEGMDPAQVLESTMIARLEPLHKLTENGTSAMQQFYSGLTVFITGGSGFLGKQLIEKLFRATNISKIFILLRCKNGKSIHQRLSEMLQDSVYEPLRKQKPNFSEKLVPISGDVAELRLGLNEEDWNTLTEQVDIVFHVAATTRFDEHIRMSTLINVRGTREGLLLGKACKKLRSYVHVSTAFSHACMDKVNTEILEKFYKSPVEPNCMISLVESVEKERLTNITAGLISNWPNTYSFTKALSEELVNTMGFDLPICIVRPAVVISAKREPLPGWLDMSCVYGASGLLLVCGIGAARVLYLDGNKALDFIPVDYVNNAIISAAWDTATNRDVADAKDIKIYTLSAPKRNPAPWGKLQEIISTHGRNYLTPKSVGYPFSHLVTNSLVFWILSLFFHILPAYIADGICVLIGKKRRFAKLAQKLYKMSIALSYFSTKYWQFDDKNAAELFDKLSPVDQEIFNFDVLNIDWKEYMVTWWIGVRKHLIKDGLKGTVYARKKQTVLKVLTIIIYLLYVYSLYKIMTIVFSFLAFLCTLFN